LEDLRRQVRVLREDLDTLKRQRVLRDAEVETDHACTVRRAGNLYCSFAEQTPLSSPIEALDWDPRLDESAAPFFVERYRSASSVEERLKDAGTLPEEQETSLFLLGDELNQFGGTRIGPGALPVSSELYQRALRMASSAAPRDRERAVHILGRSATPESRQALEGFLRDSAPSVRAAASRLLHR
jgi:hypothetical protein